MSLYLREEKHNKQMKILYFGSVSSPYQNSFWKECSKFFEIENIYLSGKESGHEWQIPVEEFIYPLDYDQSKLKSFIKLTSNLKICNTNI